MRVRLADPAAPRPGVGAGDERADYRQHQPPRWERAEARDKDMTSAKAKLLQIVECAKGDNLERARMAFSGLSAEEMARQYGASGCTRQEVFDDYLAERREWEAAKALAESIPDA